MTRERALKVVLVLVGLAVLGMLYPLTSALIAGKKSDILLQDQMILALYVPFGFFLLNAARNPAENRTLILAFACSNFLHVAVMTVQSIEAQSLGDDWPGYAGMAAASIALLALAPRRSQHAAG